MLQSVASLARKDALGSVLRAVIQVCIHNTSSKWLSSGYKPIEQTKNRSEIKLKTNRRTSSNIHSDRQVFLELGRREGSFCSVLSRH